MQSEDRIAVEEGCEAQKEKRPGVEEGCEAQFNMVSTVAVVTGAELSSFNDERNGTSLQILAVDLIAGAENVKIFGSATSAWSDEMSSCDEISAGELPRPPEEASSLAPAKGYMAELLER